MRSYDSLFLQKMIKDCSLILLKLLALTLFDLSHLSRILDLSDALDKADTSQIRLPNNMDKNKMAVNNTNMQVW